MLIGTIMTVFQFMKTQFSVQCEAGLYFYPFFLTFLFDQPGFGMNNAIMFLLDRSLSHLEKPGSTVRIMFFDFASAFNTVQPALLGNKLELTGVDQHLTS